MIQPEIGHTNEKGRNTMKCPKCGNELRESKKSPGDLFYVIPAKRNSARKL